MHRGLTLELNPGGGNHVNVRQLLQQRLGLGTAPVDNSEPARNGAESRPDADLSGSDEQNLEVLDKGRVAEAPGKRKVQDDYDYDDRFIDDGDLRYEYERYVPATRYRGFYINRGDVKLATHKPKSEGKLEEPKQEAPRLKKEKIPSHPTPGATSLPGDVPQMVAALKERIEDKFGSRKPNLQDPDLQDDLRKLFKAASSAGLAKLGGQKPGSEKRFYLNSQLWKHLSTPLRCLRLNLESLGYTLHWTEKKDASAKAVEAATAELAKAVDALRNRTTENQGGSDARGAGENKPEEGAGPGEGAPRGAGGKVDIEIDDGLGRLIHAVCAARVEHLYDRNQLAQRPKKASKELGTWLADMRKVSFAGMNVTERALGDAYRRVESKLEVERQRKKEAEREERRRKKEEEAARQKAKAAEKAKLSQESTPGGKESATKASTDADEGAGTGPKPAAAKEAKETTTKVRKPGGQAGGTDGPKSRPKAAVSGVVASKKAGAAVAGSAAGTGTPKPMLNPDNAKGVEANPKPKNAPSGGSLQQGLIRTGEAPGAPKSAISTAANTEAKPAKPAKPAKTAKPAKAGSAKAPSQASGTAKVTKPAKLVKQAQLIKPAQLVKQAKPAKPAKLAKVVKPAKPAKPGGGKAGSPAAGMGAGAPKVTKTAPAGKVASVAGAAKKSSLPTAAKLGSKATPSAASGAAKVAGASLNGASTVQGSKAAPRPSAGDGASRKRKDPGTLGGRVKVLKQGTLKLVKSAPASGNLGASAKAAPAAAQASGSGDGGPKPRDAAPEAARVSDDDKSSPQKKPTGKADGEPSGKL